MVETLIFESPVQEEPEPSPIPENVNGSPFPADHEQTEWVKLEYFMKMTSNLFNIRKKKCDKTIGPT